MFGGANSFFSGIPGMGGGFPGMGAAEEAVDTMALYTALGVSKTATAAEIRKAYMALARKEHPDKGGDPEKFKIISKAYEILSNPESRALYDVHGEKGAENSGHGAAAGGGPGGIFSQMFGGGNRRPMPRKGEDIVRQLIVTLGDLYSGKSVEVSVSREILCKPCKASGCTEGAAEVACDECEGRGIRIVMRRMGPMVQQMQQQCVKCRGQGKSIRPQDQCKACLGKKSTTSSCILQLHIEKGMRENDRIVFRGRANEIPGMEPGDVIFIIKEAPHEFLQRQGCDLVMTKRLPLIQALTGVRFDFPHVDGTTVFVISSPGDVIAPDNVRAIVGKGMPIKGNPFLKGDLFIKFEIEFPKPNGISAEDILVLKTVFIDPHPRGASWTFDEEKPEASVLTEMDTEAMKARERHLHADDEDTDGRSDGNQQQRVQCAQQ